MNHEDLSLYATAAFGLEGIVAAELRRLKMRDVSPDNGGVRFTGSVSDAFLCNLRLRCADRVMIIMGERECRSFEELYQLIFSIRWEDFLAGDEALNLSCKCARSQLMSPRDCQSISKKAMIERLKKNTFRTVFPESGASFPVHISVHSNRVRVMLDTSGSALSRRGYRTWNGEAPLRETLAAALVELSPWRPGIPLYDPCCGTGTLLIEAAFRTIHRAPGLNRSFAMESFIFTPRGQCNMLRENCRAEVLPDRDFVIAGSDIDPEAIELASRHVRQAGLEGKIGLSVHDLRKVQLSEDNGVFLCNPPYGERLSDRKECKNLYRALWALKDRHPGWKLCAISSDPEFEKDFGAHATKKRRLYNARLECNFYIYE